MGDEEEDEGGLKPSVFVPGRDTIDEDEALQYDPTAYDCMSSMSLEWPSLSFDIVADSLGDDRRAFPHTLFMVAGTQAFKPDTRQTRRCSRGKEEEKQNRRRFRFR